MTRSSSWIKRSLLSVLAVGLLASACSDEGTQRGQLTGPDQASFARGGEKGKPGKGAKVKVNEKGGRVRVWTLATGPNGQVGPFEVKPGKDSRIEMGTLGHSLFIPNGAIKQPTFFTMRAVTRTTADGQEYLAMELSAVQKNKSGAESDIGSMGFAKDVVLSLNVVNAGGETSATGASVLWIKDSSTFQEVECRTNGSAATGEACVTTSGTIVSARLKHFSDYGVGWP